MRILMLGLDAAGKTSILCACINVHHSICILLRQVQMKNDGDCFIIRMINITYTRKQVKPKSFRCASLIGNKWLTVDTLFNLYHKLWKVVIHCQ